MWLYSPVDLTGNVNMIEKLVLGVTGTGGPPDPQPDALTSAPSSHANSYSTPSVALRAILLTVWKKFFNTIFVSSHMYPENLERTQV